MTKLVVPPLLQPLLQEIHPIDHGSLLNDSKEQHEHAISLEENLSLFPLLEKKRGPHPDLFLGEYAHELGDPPSFNPCKLLHMNFAYKV